MNRKNYLLSLTAIMIAVMLSVSFISCGGDDGNDGGTGHNDNDHQLNGHEWVDLGLPSGTLWATCNIGASSPEDYGGYFAWGETTSKDYYSWSTYKYCEGTSNTLTKYNNKSNYGIVDDKTELEDADDAATVNWGSGWQMPSRGQCEELRNSSNTTSEWTSLNGVYGRKITSRTNGNSIFLPAAGERYDDTYQAFQEYGYYRSRTVSYSIKFRNRDEGWYGGEREYGQSVRPVIKK